MKLKIYQKINAISKEKTKYYYRFWLTSYKINCRRIKSWCVFRNITPKELLSEFNNIRLYIIWVRQLYRKKFQTVPKNISKNTGFRICYGLQLITKIFGGKLSLQKKKGIWRAILFKTKSFNKKFLKKKICLDGHEDAVVKIPKILKLLHQQKTQK